MKKLLFACTVFWLVAATQAVAANAINAVRIQPSPDKTRVVFDLSSAPDYSYFTIYEVKPDRLVIDFNGTRLNTELGQLELSGKRVTKIRTSTPKNAQSTRIVLELTGRFTPNVFLLGPNDRFSDRLVVDLYDRADEVPGETAASDTESSSSQGRSNQPARTVDELAQRKVVIAIDAGHGGDDPGSIGPSGTYEKDVVLRVSRALADIINADPDMEAHLIRTGDYYVAHKRRVRKAEQLQADMLISVHADAFTTPQPRGGSVWVLSTRRATTEQGRLLEDKERFSELLGGVEESVRDDDDNGYLARAIVDMRMNDAMARGFEAAEDVIAAMKRVTRMHKTKPQHASLAVLTSANITSMLVEIGFISNPQEEKLLLSNKHQQQIARAIYQGARDYFMRRPPDGTSIASNRMIIHTVKSGESLSVLAQRYGTTVKAIKERNQLRSNVLRIGQQLEIPR